MTTWRTCKGCCWRGLTRATVIPKSGGLRKLCVAAKGHGKRGGARMIYYWVVARDRILMLDIYAKNEKEDLSAGELKQLRTLIEDYLT